MIILLVLIFVVTFSVGVCSTKSANNALNRNLEGSQNSDSDNQDIKVKKKSDTLRLSQL